MEAIRAVSFTTIFNVILVLVVVSHWEFLGAGASKNSLALKSRLMKNTTRHRNSPLVTGNDNLPSSLQFLGAVKNKSFYTDPDIFGVAWTEALDFCHELGLHPASLENLAEHRLTRNYLANLPHKFFWLAGTDYFKEGSWRWLKTGKSFKYTKWMAGYPSKSRRNNCLYLSYGNDGWVDANCSTRNLNIRPLCQNSR